MVTRDCCSDSTMQSEAISPFRENIALGYYDGPTDGVVRCQRCASVYFYALVAWDEGQDIRIYALRALPVDVFAQLEQILAKNSPPKYPDWIPVWDAVIVAQQKRIDELLFTAADCFSEAVYLVMGESPTGLIRIRTIDRAIRRALIVRASQGNRIDDLENWVGFFGECKGTRDCYKEDK
jgi:hypothetical protein